MFSFLFILSILSSYSATVDAMCSTQAEIVNCLLFETLGKLEQGVNSAVAAVQKQNFFRLFSGLLFLYTPTKLLDLVSADERDSLPEFESTWCNFKLQFCVVLEPPILPQVKICCGQCESRMDNFPAFLRIKVMGSFSLREVFLPADTQHVCSPDQLPLYGRRWTASASLGRCEGSSRKEWIVFVELGVS